MKRVKSSPRHGSRKSARWWAPAPSAGATGVPCPKCGKGNLVEKSSKRGKIFYSCDQYPACDYALWDWPINEKCPECDSPLLVLKTTRARGRHIACPNPKCRYSRDTDEPKE